MSLFLHLPIPHPPPQRTAHSPADDSEAGRSRLAPPSHSGFPSGQREAQGTPDQRSALSSVPRVLRREDKKESEKILKKVDIFRYPPFRSYGSYRLLSCLSVFCILSLESLLSCCLFSCELVCFLLSYEFCLSAILL